MREFSSIRCLTFVIPLVSQLLQKTGALFILINKFCNRGRDRKWSFYTIFLSKKVSDQISTISLIIGPSIFSLSISFLLRFPNSKKWLPPYFPSARLKKFFPFATVKYRNCCLHLQEIKMDYPEETKRQSCIFGSENNWAGLTETIVKWRECVKWKT